MVSRVFVFLLFAGCLGGQLSSASERARIEFRVKDEAGGITPCRIHLSDATGTSHAPKDLPVWQDHFVCPGEADIELEPGEYSWVIERGPEHRRLVGAARLKAGELLRVEEVITRLANLREDGWYSGDLHVHRSPSDIALLMDAEDLDFVPVIGWWNQPARNVIAIDEIDRRVGGRIYCLGAGEDEREGGALLYFGLSRPLDLSVKSREFPSPMEFVAIARNRNPNVWLDIEKPFWWDVPTWLAVAKPNSIGIAHNHMHRSGVLGNEAWGKARDQLQYPGIPGNGLWSQAIYYHILNCGIHLPPSAGSASGVLPNPVGYNRVYVHLGQAELNRENWFKALESGRCFVTNGPLLRGKANGELTGKELQYSPGMTIKLELEVNSNDPISHLEVVHNGRVIERLDCEESEHKKITESFVLPGAGWFLVRAVTDVKHTFRFASTAPWYVSRTDGEPWISQQSSAFFLDWIDERIERVARGVADPNEKAAILRWHHQARKFWDDRFVSANAELVSRRQESWKQTRKRLIKALEIHYDEDMVFKPLAAIKSCEDRDQFYEALEPLVALDISINPESRVKVLSRSARISLKKDHAQSFLVKVENTAGITAPLNLVAFDMATNPPGLAEWCSIEVVDDTLSSQTLTGAVVEFKLVKISSTDAGLREVRIVGDAGQGTQDLGFRATTDVLLDIDSK